MEYCFTTGLQVELLMKKMITL
uniref:Uncharacterized protein n=1 Tax=Anguilla anguilla TaxID=7936 RepID=A0A0E9RDA3_ANGAN